MDFFNFWWGTTPTEPAAATAPVVEAKRKTLCLAKPRDVVCTTTVVRETLTVATPLPVWEKRRLEAERKAALAAEAVAETVETVVEVPRKPAKPKLTQKQLQELKRAKAKASRDRSYHPGERGSILERRGVMIHGLPAHKLATVK